MTVWHCRKLTIDQQNTHRIHASTHSYSKLFAECLLYSRHCARTWGGGQINNSWNLSSLPGKKTSRCTATELNQRVCNLCRRLDEGEDRCVWGCQRRLPHSPWGPAVYPHIFMHIHIWHPLPLPISPPSSIPLTDSTTLFQREGKFDWHLSLEALGAATEIW